MMMWEDPVRDEETVGTQLVQVGCPQYRRKTVPDAAPDPVSGGVCADRSLHH